MLRNCTMNNIIYEITFDGRNFICISNVAECFIMNPPECRNLSSTFTDQKQNGDKKMIRWSIKKIRWKLQQMLPQGMREIQQQKNGVMPIHTEKSRREWGKKSFGFALPFPYLVFNKRLEVEKHVIL
ncbi:hypothetical protein TNIN_316451 [Trichonephila inaurata madagascariensis]|uniref:Uncharacterized protein n=1 Tax=Trichonephila inaurata madagascariensis TaxID=2747483 RepID=A0A8X6JWR5_9ARAC|nr:hypothetical protein TNIN_316451 [Trichonephila inaurata madagascariensis]